MATSAERKINVSGYEDFKKAVKTHENAGKQLNIYFTGQKDEQGKSWCPDCNDAEPHVMKALEQYAENESIFLVVDVGERSFWKDMQNPFRQDAKVKLSVIPTLLRWNSVARLDGEHCAKSSLLEMFFTEGDD